MQNTSESETNSEMSQARNFERKCTMRKAYPLAITSALLVLAFFAGTMMGPWNVHAAPPAQSPAQTTRPMTVAEATSIIDSKASDQYADSLTVALGDFADNNGIINNPSSVGNWNVTGPALISVDPQNQAISNAVVVKTYQYRQDWIFGVYFCPTGSTCNVPTPGRSFALDADLPASYLHTTASVAPVAATPVGSNATTGSSCPTTRAMTVAEAQNLIDATASDEYASTLTVLFGEQAESQCITNASSSVGGWTTTGPSVILTDPGHLALSNVTIVKTWNMDPSWIFGVYFCPSGNTCQVPTPGRAITLDADLPASYQH